MQIENASRKMKPTHALTIDLEDWYQSSVDRSSPITARVVRNTVLLLNFLDELDVKATFFVQGKVADSFPDLIRDAHDLGHEIQSHGYSHIPIHHLSVSAFRDDVSRSSDILAGITGQKVTAYRAPDFSINEKNGWALDVLADCGIQVDSSIFPMKTWRYGVSGMPLQPYELTTPNGSSLLEVPVAVWSFRKRRIPIAGGGYLRLLPYLVIRQVMRAIESEVRPAVVYCHPYEFAANEIDEYAGEVNPLFAVYQKLGRRRLVRRLKLLLQDFHFGRLDQCIEKWQADARQS
jgi:polysaccharide deacetylase family protein (PEP-CTERM system associated)